MTHARRSHPLTALRAFLASGRLWLCELMLWLAGVFHMPRTVRGELVAELHALRQAVALLVFMEHRPVLAQASPRAHHPRNAPRGFAHARLGGDMRLIWRIVPQGVGLKRRIAALRAAIDGPAKFGARLRKRLSCAPHAPAILLVVAPCETATIHTVLPVAIDDSS